MKFDWVRSCMTRLWRREHLRTQAVRDQLFEDQRLVRQSRRRQEILRHQAQVVIEGILHDRQQPHP